MSENKTQGEFVADLIERYCEVHTLAANPNMPSFVGRKMLEDAKAALSAGLDQAFVEMIPQTLEDLI